MSGATLALDAATTRLTLALSSNGRATERHVDGPRRHANEILGLVDDLLAEHRLAVPDIGRVITGDGPGSFTGLRVAASVAKALVWRQPEVLWYTAPSLLVRALAASRGVAGSQAVVLALSDALRGELYAGCWRVSDQGVQPVGPSPRAMLPAALEQFGPVDAVIGSIPEPLVDLVHAVSGVTPITGDAALPDARDLISLADLDSGVELVADPAAWHPEYGRPAEAQAVWERKFGRRLPDSTYHSG